MDEDAGKGVSTDASDVLVPMVYILQPLSPQVLRDKDDFIEGAEPGHIWLKNAAENAIQGDIWFQPCAFWKKWVEWVPRKQGGGFVGSYDKLPEKSQQWKDPENPRSIKWKMPNGSQNLALCNDLVETRYFAGYVLEEDESHAREYIIALASTGHTFGKKLMFQLKQREHKPGMIAPSFASMFHLITKMKSNNAGEWYVFDLDDDPANGVRWVTSKEQYVAGRRLEQAFSTGILKADLASTSEGGAGEGDGDTM